MRPQFTSATIVLLGKFTPDAFLPNALGEAKVISKKDAKLATLRTLIPGTVVNFALLWCELLVSTDRLQIGTAQAPYVRISDVVVKALKDVRGESRVTAFGINVESHFDLGSISARDVMGSRLAPPKEWGKWGEEILESMRTASPGTHGGMVSLQMRKPFTEERVAGWLDVVVGPSPIIPDNSGVFFRTNHHHQVPVKLADTDENQDSRQAGVEPLALLDALAERFDASILSAENIFNCVIEKYSQ